SSVRVQGLCFDMHLQLGIQNRADPLDRIALGFGLATDFESNEKLLKFWLLQFIEGCEKGIDTRCGDGALVNLGQKRADLTGCISHRESRRLWFSGRPRTAQGDH